MPRGSNQKFKFSYLMEIMLSRTDDEHALTMPEIISELEKKGVTAERKSLYSDLQDMGDEFGIEILKEKRGRETFYHVGARKFELAEVKLLIDAIQSSKFITQKKSRDLISKIKTLVSDYDAARLQRQVYINDRVKSMNESVYYIIDDIHGAINENRKIRFKYCKWDIRKRLVERHKGDWFVVSPWALTWNDENYYLLAFDDLDGRIKHYRVDKMMHISILEEERAGREDFRKIDMAEYAKSTFGMYQGTRTIVSIELDNSMCGVFIDRFGKEIIFHPIDEEHSRLDVSVNVSPQFFGWIFGLGKKVRVTGPYEVVEQMKLSAAEFLENMG